jgi:hypothetical protein
VTIDGFHAFYDLACRAGKIIAIAELTSSQGFISVQISLKSFLIRTLK